MIQVVLAHHPGHPSRRHPYVLVSWFLASFGWPLVLAGAPDGQPFNAGRAKNHGVRLAAEANGARPDDVLLMADADCVCHPDFILEAVWEAYNAPGIVWAGKHLRILDRESTDALSRWEDALQCGGGELRPADETPQLYAIRRDAFEQVGGYDDSYIGYGFEDYDFRDRCRDLWPHRSPGATVVHLWHEPDPEKGGGPMLEANHRRYLESRA